MPTTREWSPRLTVWMDFTLICMLEKHLYRMSRWLPETSETLIKAHSATEACFTPSSPTKWDMTQTKATHLYLYIQYTYCMLIEHKQECLKSLHWTTAALHLICVFILPARGPSIYGQLKNTNNHPPPVKNRLLLSEKFCNAFVYAHAAFWLPVYYCSVSAEANRDPANPKKGAKPSFFSSLFLPVTSLCISPWIVICVLSATWVAHIERERCALLFDVVRDVFWVLDAVTSFASSIMTRAPFFHRDEALTRSGFWDFQLKCVICQPKHDVATRAYNLNKHPFNTFQTAK